MLWLAGLLFLAIRKLAKKWKNKHLWFLPFTLLTLAVFALAIAPLPFGWGTTAGIVAWLASWVFGWLGGLFGVSAQVIGAIALVVVLMFGLHDLIKDHKPDSWAKIMVFTLPVLALVAGGSIAAHILQFTHLVGNVGPSVVTSLAG